MESSLTRVVTSRGELQLVQLLEIVISPQNIILTRRRACTLRAKFVMSTIDEWFTSNCVRGMDEPLIVAWKKTLWTIIKSNFYSCKKAD